MIFPIEAGEKTCQTAFSESIFAATKTLNTQQHERNDSQILEKMVRQGNRRTSDEPRLPRNGSRSFQAGKGCFPLAHARTAGSLSVLPLRLPLQRADRAGGVCPKRQGPLSTGGPTYTEYLLHRGKGSRHQLLGQGREPTALLAEDSGLPPFHSLYG